ncbi:MAG: hypothetical protein BJ554DRAFT_1196, partial [Olpidium bornovanus]
KKKKKNKKKKQKKNKKKAKEREKKRESERQRKRKVAGARARKRKNDPPAGPRPFNRAQRRSERKFLIFFFSSPCYAPPLCFFAFCFSRKRTQVSYFFFFSSPCYAHRHPSLSLSLFPLPPFPPP